MSATPVSGVCFLDENYSPALSITGQYLELVGTAAHATSESTSISGTYSESNFSVFDA